MSLIVEALVLERMDGVRLLGPLGLSLAPGDRLSTGIRETLPDGCF